MENKWRRLISANAVESPVTWRRSPRAWGRRGSRAHEGGSIRKSLFQDNLIFNIVQPTFHFLLAGQLGFLLFFDCLDMIGKSCVISWHGSIVEFSHWHSKYLRHHVALQPENQWCRSKCVVRLFVVEQRTVQLQYVHNFERKARKMLSTTNWIYFPPEIEQHSRNFPPRE